MPQDIRAKCSSLQDAICRTISPTLARRLAVMRQRLAGPRSRADAGGIMDVARSIGYIQFDPIGVVAPSHLLVFWSRLGNYDVATLDRLLWDERELFEDWAQATSFVLMEDYPIFSKFKQSYGSGDSPRSRYVRKWMRTNKALRLHILSKLRRSGPLSSSDLEDRAVMQWHSSGWTSGRNVDMMLTFLSAQGKVMVARRSGARKLWDLTGKILPEWASRERLSWKDVVSRAAQKSLRALGVASQSQIEKHYIRGCYPGLSDVLVKLKSEGRVECVQIVEPRDDLRWKGVWYVHADDLPLLDRLSAGEWEPRTTLLSPFDNLICDRRRAEQLFNFQFSSEIYVPKSKRKYGYYVMPILHGDRLIGRLDPAMDQEKEELMINAVYAEPDAPMTQEMGKSIANAIADLAAFLGAKQAIYGKHMPERWKGALH